MILDGALSVDVGDIVWLAGGWGVTRGDSDKTDSIRTTSTARYNRSIIITIHIR